jgi:hypothetical protein
MRKIVIAASMAGLLVVAGCAGTPELGKGASVATGSAGQAGTHEASQQLIRCDKPLGTAALVEPESNSVMLLQSVGLQSPTPVLRLMMAQSKCFRVVDRGAAMGNLQAEQQLKQSGMLRAGSTTAHGRMVTVQWLITPNVVFSNPNAGGAGAAGAVIGAVVGSFIPGGALLGAAVANVRVKEAQTALYLTDAQTGEQTAVAEGSASVTDFGGGAGLGGFGSSIAGFGGIGGYGNTAEGKLVAAAYLDAYNKLVEQIRATNPNRPTVGDLGIRRPVAVASNALIPD